MMYLNIHLLSAPSSAGRGEYDVVAQRRAFLGYVTLKGRNHITVSPKHLVFGE
jgi:hypothetical protein